MVRRRLFGVAAGVHTSALRRYAKISLTDKQRLVDLVVNKEKLISAAAAKLRIAKRTASSMIKRYQEGRMDNKKGGGAYSMKMNQEQSDYIKDLIQR